MSEAKRLSVIIPVLNERGSLPAVLEEIPKDLALEIIVVDGHSTDGTPEIVRELGYTVIPQEGRGYGLAVQTGLKAATGELVTFMDGDGSYNPSALPQLLECIDAGNDIAFCSRYLPGSGSDDDTWIRYTGNMIFTRLLRLLFGVRITDSLFFYALGKKEMFEALELELADFALCIEVPVKVHRKGYRYTEIPSKERLRIAGASKVNAVSDGFRILTAMLQLWFSR
jgi:glycosyltransferase involved in cell wall biosynthesis